MNKTSHIVMLFFAALFWGTTLVAQAIGADYVGAFTYLAARSWIAVVFLTPVIPLMDKFFDARGKDNRRPRNAYARRLLRIAGTISGCMLLLASSTQQIGIAYTTASKAGFLTDLYVVLVPILSIFAHKRPPLKIWGCVALSILGIYLLCMTKDRLTIEVGDAFVLLSAVLYSFEIMIIYHFSSMVEGVRMSRQQFLVVAILSTVIMFVFEHPTWESIRMAMPAILYAGIISSGLGYTLQILGQDNVNPTLACLVMSLEGVFSALAGWIILHERMSLRELTGCGLMFLAIILAQVDIGGSRKKISDTDQQT